MENLKISVPAFSLETGIPKDRIYKWKQQGTSPKSEDERKILSWIEKMEKVPRESKGLELNDETKPYHKRRLDLKNGTKKQIPFYDAPAAGGITETEMTPIHAPAGTIDVGDLLHDSQAAIRIYGNSMLPNYPPGCVVGLAKVETGSIQPGEVYVVETKNERLLKRLFYKDDDPESDFFLFYSDNIMKFEGGARDGKLAYPPFLRHKREIINLFVVTGVIKRNTNSVIINR